MEEKLIVFVTTIQTPHFEAILEIINKKKYKKIIFVNAFQNAPFRLEKSFIEGKIRWFIGRLRRNNFLKENKINKIFNQISEKNKNTISIQYPKKYNLNLNYDYPLIKSIRMRIHSSLLQGTNDKRFVKILKAHTWAYQNTLNFIKKNIKNRERNTFLIFNGRMPIDSGILRACKKKGFKKFIYHEMNTYNNKYHYKITPWHELKHFNIEINKLLKDYPDNKIINEAKKFIIYQGLKNQKKKRKRNLKKKILFICSTINEYYWHYKEPINQIKIINLLLTDQKITSEYEITFRVHPNLSNFDTFSQNLWFLLKKKYPENIILHNNTINTYKLLENSDLSISIGSSLAPQSIILGIPHLLIGDQNPYCKVNFCTVETFKNFFKNYEKIIKRTLKSNIKYNDILKASASLVYENHFGYEFRNELLSKSIYEIRRRFLPS